MIYGTVIPYRAARWPYGTPHYWDAHYAAIATQGADWLRLKREFPSYSFCVAGDFNQTRSGRYYYGTRWGRLLLDLALMESKLIGVTQIDFPAAKKFEQEEQEILKRSIDHICLDGRTAAKVFRTGVWPGKTSDGVHLSDHNGVFVDVAI